ncbi:MAG: hypothetical protein QM811_07845 [Pirellulales bacterium]
MSITARGVFVPTLRAAFVIGCALVIGCAWEPLLQMPDPVPEMSTVQRYRVPSTGRTFDVIRREMSKSYTTMDDEFSKRRTLGLEVTLHEHDADAVGKSVHRLACRSTWKKHHIVGAGKQSATFDADDAVPTGRVVQVDDAIYFFAYDLKSCRAAVYSESEGKFVDKPLHELDQRVRDTAYRFEPDVDPSWLICLVQHGKAFGRKPLTGKSTPKTVDDFVQAALAGEISKDETPGIYRDFLAAYSKQRTSPL